MKTITIDGIEIPVEKLIAQGWTAPKPNPNMRWKPEVGEGYWSLVHRGLSITGDNDIVDERLWRSGRVFKTKQESLANQRRIEAKVKVIDKLRELEGDWVADWGGAKQVKYYVFFKHLTYDIGISGATTGQQQNPEWYSTKEAWQWVVDHMEDDLKLIWGVEK